tara:strand:+ start:166 stop:1461 length:1296 start_codon:yes stop_codon:yes gene_type:complete
MGGGLMQLVAYGAQDIYLTGNPQITFFKVVYRRHTNFSMESIQQTFNGTADFGGSVSATISRNGDLVHRMYLEHEATLQAADETEDNIGIGTDYGSHLMKEVELEIGGQRIDRHYGHWHSVYSQLTEFNPSGATFGGDVGGTETQGTLFQKMTGNGRSIESQNGNNNNTNMGGWLIDSNATGTAAEASGKFWIPLYFWFCRNPGLALPLIALQYHEVKVKISFETLANLTLCDQDGTFASGTAAAIKKSGGTNSFNLWCDYIYLDTDERRRFAQVSHEYLIEQLQFESKTGGATMDLNFNHPVKELIWAGVKSTAAAEAPTFCQRGPIGTGTYQLKLNGHDRFKERDVKYFTRTQIWEHHTGYGCTEAGDTIGVYSFALKPEEHQPSGTCNFSRIDNAQLVDSTTADINVYAVNYNVLRIMSGMGGLAYSN